jgi:hypothetical protein
MFKSIKNILLTLTIVISSNALADNSQVINKTTVKNTDAKGKQIIEHFITDSGVECVKAQSTGYALNGLGLSCNWDAYNKKKELQAHISHSKAVNEAEIAHKKVLKIKHDIFDNFKEEFEIYSISIKNNIRLLRSMNKQEEADFKLAEYNIKLAKHVVAIDTHHRNYGFRNTNNNTITTAMVNQNNEN